MYYTTILSIILIFFLRLTAIYAQTDENTLADIQPSDSIVSLDAVTVEGFRLSNKLRTFPGSLSVLAGKGLNLSDGTNMATTLNSIPGISMQSGTYATNRIVIRGMGSRTPYNTNRIHAYLNEIPLTMADGVSTPEEVDMQSIGRIEVIKGPASALYGSGLGGNINLYTPVKLKNEATFKVNYGSFNTLRNNLSGTVNAGKANLWGSLSHLQSDGYRGNNEYKRTSFLSTAQWKQTKWAVKSTLMLTDVHGEIPSSLSKTQFENDPRAAAPNWAAIAGFKKYRKALAGTTLTNIFSSTLSNYFTIHGKWSDAYEKRPFNNLTDHTMSAGVRNKLSYCLQKTDLIFGLDYTAEQYTWKLDKNEILLNENRENRNQFSVFGILNYRPSIKLNISVAGTLNYISYQLTDLYSANGNQSDARNFPFIVSPRLGFNYTATANLVVYASVGHGFSLPSPEETLLPAGDVNPDIKPEQGMQYEIGTRFNFFENAVEIDAGVYWIELNDLLVTKRITEDIFTGINAGKSRHQGFELLLRNRFFHFSSFPGKLTSTFGYTFSRNRFIRFTDDENTYDGNELPGIPDELLQLQLTWNPAEKIEVLTHLQYTGSQYLNDANTMKYDGYLLLNIKVSTQFQLRKVGHFNVFVGVNNLTDCKYASMLVVNAIGFGSNEPRFYYPGLPRNIFAGIEFRL